MLGIIGAMDSEVAGLKQKMTDISIAEISGREYVTGIAGGVEIVVAKAGVGKVNAAITTEAMILKYAPDAIINIGVAGSIDSSLNIGDTVVATNVVQHDMNTTGLGEPRGFIDGLNKIYIETDSFISELIAKASRDAGQNTLTGTVASGDLFVSDGKTRTSISTEFSAMCAEMEGASIGHVCAANNIPFAVLRTMSDGADNDSPVDFPTFAAETAKKAIDIIIRFLKLYKDNLQ